MGQRQVVLQPLATEEYVQQPTGQRCKVGAVTPIRLVATEVTNAQLDAARVSELRAQGAAMTEDEATAYALDAIARIGPRRAYLTHMSHDLGHAATNARLPAGVELAYDGLVLDARVDAS